MITMLSGSRPIVTIGPTAYSFNTWPSNCRISFGIMPSSDVSFPAVRNAPPPAARHFQYYDRNVVGAAIAVGGGDQVIANPLRLPKLTDGVGQHMFRHHPRQPI